MFTGWGEKVLITETVSRSCHCQSDCFGQSGSLGDCLDYLAFLCISNK